jgi:signal transduction histidine kinase
MDADHRRQSLRPRTGAPHSDVCGLSFELFPLGTYSRGVVTLEASNLFGQLGATELQQLRQVTHELSFRPSELIFKEGDPGDGVYVVKSGAVQISALVGADERQVLSRVLPGDVFGEMTLLDDLPRSACASAEVETAAYFVPRAPMVELLRRCPDLALRLVKEVSERLREFNRQYIRKVVQAERMAIVGRFASSIVHDLKNPLTIISLASERAALPSATPETRRAAHDHVARQVERIGSLVNDILDFTRGSMGAVALTETNYAAFVEPLVEELRREVEPKAVAIEFESPPPAVKLALHPQRLSRVFHNLVHNAVDAMSGGGRVKLRFALSDTEVVTEIEDTGKGIAPEILDRLFEAFATFGKPRGTGLGLSISQKIIEEHGGRIWARNRDGGGAIFAFALPRPK